MNNGTIIASAWMPDGKGGWQPVPNIMTPEEAIRYMRIDSLHPKQTLRYYRGENLLKSTRIGKKIRYTREALDEFAKAMTKK